MKMKNISFQGCLYKLQLTASDIAYGPCPAPDEEVEQRLTITRNGMVWFSRWAFGCGIKPSLICRERFRIDSDAVATLFGLVEAFFSGCLNMVLVVYTDVWNLELTNTDRAVYHYYGSVCRSLVPELDMISDQLRLLVGRSGLIAFNGRPE